MAILDIHVLKTESDFFRHQIKKYPDWTAHTISNSYSVFKQFYSGELIQKCTCGYVWTGSQLNTQANYTPKFEMFVFVVSPFKAKLSRVGFLK